MSLSLSAVLGKQFLLPSSYAAIPPHFTLVARLPQVHNTAIGEIVAKLRRKYPSHHYYPSETIHLTIKNLDSIGFDNIERIELLNQLRNCIESCGPFFMQGKGLGVSPNSVFLQLFPEDHSLANLRRKLSSLDQRNDRISKQTVFDMLLTALFRELAFANLVRFSGSLSTSLIRDIGRYRSTCFARFPIEVLQVVQTDKLLSNAGTKIISQFTLAESTPSLNSGLSPSNKHVDGS
jgi:2'-5' RNA ligase